MSSDAKARVTACLRADGSFELLLNEVGRDLLIKELQNLDRRWDHFHLDHFRDRDIANATDIPLSVNPYREDDKIIKNAKVLFRP